MHKHTPIDEQRLAVASFRKYLDSEVAPVAREFRDRPMPKGRMRELTLGIAEFGLPGASIAEEHGGMGLGRTTEALLFEELCAVSADVALCVKTNKAVASLLAGLPPQHAALRERYLPDILSGRSFAAICLGESDIDLALSIPGIAAYHDGDELILDGQEPRVANGHYADFIVLLAHPGDGGSLLLLVDRRLHGFVTRNIDKIALNSQSTAQLSLTQTRVPATQVLEDEAGRKALIEATRTDTAMLCVGLMRAAIEASVDYTRQQPSATHQLVAAQLAEMATLADAARLLCLRAYERIDAGQPSGTQASMAKWYASEMAVQVCRNAVQLHGGSGLERGYEVERLAREAITLPLFDGTTDFHKLLIAQTLTGNLLPS